MEIGFSIARANLTDDILSRMFTFVNENTNAEIHDDGVYFTIKEKGKPSETKKLMETLRMEKRELEEWLSSHDYIGTKIATGRATIEEYKEVIEEMKAKANRINEINKLLETL